MLCCRMCPCSRRAFREFVVACAARSSLTQTFCVSEAFERVGPHPWTLSSATVCRSTSGWMFMESSYWYCRSEAPLSFMARIYKHSAYDDTRRARKWLCLCHGTAPTSFWNNKNLIYESLEQHQVPPRVQIVHAASISLLGVWQCWLKYSFHLQPNTADLQNGRGATCLPN
jgi:hypothetical protein